MEEADFRTVDNQQELDEFLDLVGGLHGALLREVTLLARGYVSPEGWMHGDAAPHDARLVFHSQNRDTPWIELIFEDVEVFQFRPSWDFEANGTIDQGQITIWFAAKTNAEACVMKARTMRYRIGGVELLGDTVRTVSAIPTQVREPANPR